MIEMRLRYMKTESGDINARLALAYAAARALTEGTPQRARERDILVREDIRVMRRGAAINTKLRDLLPAAEELLRQGAIEREAYRLLEAYADPDYGLDTQGRDARVLDPPPTLGTLFQEAPRPRNGPGVPDGLNEIARYRTGWRR